MTDFKLSRPIINTTIFSLQTFMVKDKINNNKFETAIIYRIAPDEFGDHLVTIKQKKETGTHSAYIGFINSSMLSKFKDLREVGDNNSTPHSSSILRLIGRVNSSVLLRVVLRYVININGAPLETILSVNDNNQLWLYQPIPGTVMAYTNIYLGDYSKWRSVIEGYLSDVVETWEEPEILREREVEEREVEYHTYGTTGFRL